MASIHSTIHKLQAIAPHLTAEQCLQIMTLVKSKRVSSSSLLPVTPHRWIIDSGATHHITSFSKLLMNIDENPSLAPVSLPSGAKAKISMTGSVRINDFELNNVLCVPSFRVDLMSVSKTIDDLHYSVTFFPS